MAFFDNIKFPFFTMQELNLDWLLKEVKRIAGFMPQDGNVGDVLTRKSDGAEWEPPDAVNININALPEDTAITDNDQLVFYDISASANRKIKPPNLLDSMMSNGTPLMDGTASPGTSKKPARYDHKHPTDTSRQAALTGTQMNAVNSGAPSASFNNGKLKIENGGTNADTAAEARENLETIRYNQNITNVTKAAEICTLGIAGNSSRTINFNSTGFCMGLIFTTGAVTAVRENIAFGSTFSSAISYTTEFTGSDLTVSVTDRAMTISNGASSYVYLIIINIEGKVISVV